tara:strand:- start:910 stop:1017 length:108 start_codon:yes stop_codon:yes gene_type:complete
MVKNPTRNQRKAEHLSNHIEVSEENQQRIINELIK